MRQVQGVTNDRADAAAPSGRRDADAAGVVDEVPDDQEVGGIAELFDHAQFAVQPSHHFVGELAIDDAFVVAFVAFHAVL